MRAVRAGRVRRYIPMATLTQETLGRPNMLHRAACAMVAGG